ncbi:receptor expression-enhancing protein 5-like isoform X3 [Styela clava]|uniref:receptor expression-enhancing protein 5-like isoform X3 n=1 Tax=Styela clava TaxID=7725 RepID=UPI00193A7635|nr:receptor expression-enhancing protein 5-like isoform X3 [Styela clava]
MSSDEEHIKNLYQKTVDVLRRHGVYELVKKPRTLYGLLGFFLMWIASGYFASLICNAIGFVYPAYKSVKAIESKDKDDDTEWLMYWVVFATFSVVEFFSDIFLSWFPFYFLAKCVFLLWCMAPGGYNGSSMIYFKFIRPFILKNESVIDNALNVVQGGAKKIADVATSEAKDAAAAVAAEVVSESLKKDE